MDALLRFWPLAVITLVPVVIFRGHSLVNETYSSHDVIDYFYPYRTLVAKLVRLHEWPLWNQFSFSGQSLIGDAQAGIFNPVNIPYFLSPSILSFNLIFFFCFWTAGTGMYFLCLHFRLSKAPALCSAVTFMLSGYMVSRIIHLSILNGSALLPWIALAAIRALDRPSPQRVAFTGGLLAVQVFAGHPQPIIYTVFTLFSAVLFWRPDRLNFVARLSVVSISGVAGILFSAVQLLPWFEAISLSNRASTASADFVFFGVTQLKHMALFVFPYALGSVTPSYSFPFALPLSNQVEIWEHSVYVGIAPLVLAALALVAYRDETGTATETFRNRAQVHLSMACIVLGLLLACAPPGVRDIVYYLPGIGKLRDVERAMLLVVFGLSLLAGIGAQQVYCNFSSRIRSGAAVALTLLGLIILLLLINAPSLQLAILPRQVLICAIFLGGTAALLVPARSSPIRSKMIAISLPVLIIMDLCVFSSQFHAFATPSVSTPPAVAALLRARPRARKLTLVSKEKLPIVDRSKLLAPSSSLLFNIEDANGFNSLQARRYTDFLLSPAIEDVSYGGIPDDVSTTLMSPRNPILNALDVQFLITSTRFPVTPPTPDYRLIYSDADVLLYEHTASWGRIFLADTVLARTNSEEILSFVTTPGFDPRRTSIVEGTYHIRVGQPSSQDSATIVEYGNNRIVGSVSTREPRLLVLSEMYYPGWKAEIDGKTVQIMRTNYLFRGVLVPPGTHSVSMTYQPRSLVVGALLSGGAAIAFLFACLQCRVPTLK